MRDTMGRGEGGIPELEPTLGRGLGVRPGGAVLVREGIAPASPAVFASMRPGWDLYPGARAVLEPTRVWDVYRVSFPRERVSVVWHAGSQRILAVIRWKIAPPMPVGTPMTRPAPLWGPQLSRRMVSLGLEVE